ncbi:MAG: hypothetical protein NW201_15475 [Gemmatimonadales bacterium]|nr:hypothetical protein [Gemmatimonadales bacterium]
MSLTPLVGHVAHRDRIAGAVAEGRLPQVLLITGPAGVGRQRLALWTGQLLLCTSRGTTGPCGACRACRLVLQLAHPDLHWFVPIPRPKAGEPDKQVDEAAEALAEVMTARRGKPVWGTPDGMSIHGVASARLLQRRASLTPVEGRTKVFIIGDAERLVPQESSQEAANALLKLLEEPPADTVILLTATDARRVLPTIRSRAVVLRLEPLAEADVRTAVRQHLDPVPADAQLDALVRRADGCVGRALTEERSDAGAAAAAQVLADALDRSAAPRARRALAQGTFAARGEFSEMLDALALLLGDAARAGAGVAPARALPAAARALDATRALQALEHVEAARAMAQGNVNPQLILAALGDDLQEALCR